MELYLGTCGNGYIRYEPAKISIYSSVQHISKYRGIKCGGEFDIIFIIIRLEVYYESKNVVR